MNTALSYFCDICGTLVPAQATLCAACGKPPRAPTSTAAVRVQAVQAMAEPIALSGRLPSGSLQSGSLFAGHYHILGKVGEGGFGLIYKAEDIDRHRKLVAIKQINLSTLSPREMIEATDSYNREVRYLSRLRHSSLPQIYDTFTDPEHWYIVMDFIDGETLEDKLKKRFRRRLSVKKVLDIGVALCDVLDYLHAQQPPIIFRDVKPANIMLTKKGHIYLIDFGIARHYTQGRNRDTGPLGTPGYAAPEQYGKAQTTTQTDIYGLGATLQTLLTGKEPQALKGKKRRWLPRRKARRQLDQLLERMLEADRSKRPSSMGEVRHRLQQIVHKPGQKAGYTLAALRQAFVDALLFTMLVVIFFLFIFVQYPLALPLLYLLLALLSFVLRLIRLLREGFDH